MYTTVKITVEAKKDLKSYKQDLGFVALKLVSMRYLKNSLKLELKMRRVS